MATYFKNVLESEIGTEEVLVLSTPDNARATVIGLSLTNLTNGVVLASVRVEDTVSSKSAHYIKEVILPPSQSLRVINGGERLVLGSLTNLKIQSNVDNSLDLVLSYVEIV